MARPKRQKIYKNTSALEFTFTSEVSIVKAHRAKEKQYQEIIQALEEQGWKVELHIIIMGVKGWMPTHTWEALGKLGITKFRRQQLYKELSRLAVNSLISCINTRRKLESRGAREGTNKTESGFVRFNTDRAKEKKEKRQTKYTTSNQKKNKNWRKQAQPKKGEG